MVYLTTSDRGVSILYTENTHSKNSYEHVPAAFPAGYDPISAGDGFAYRNPRIEHHQPSGR
jgi:hypothetical protein